MDDAGKLAKTLDALEQWRKLNARVTALEQQVVELKAKLALPKCPYCGVPAWRLVDSRPDPNMHELGIVQRTYRCDACGRSEQHSEE